jgi:site-specific DNA recombinase
MHGMASQETRCREFARMKGYTVERVFTDEAVSGGLIERPGMREMLNHLRAHRKAATFVVLIDDISRLARDIKAHLELRSAISGAGARLESPSVEFGEDSDSILVENLLASVSQHQRQKNAEQTRNRMRARIMNGYWPFITCIGFRHESKPGEGRVLVRDEPVASIIQEGLEGFATGRFQIQAELKRFFESRPDFPRDGRGQVRNQLVNDILTKPLYAGYVEAPDWDVPLRKGRHEGLISFDAFERIQQRLNEGAKMPARADINCDFPLRGAIACACCNRPMTAAWSTGKSGTKHAYYACFSKGCTRYRKSIRRDQIEGAFVALLEKLTPGPRLLELARAMFKDAWNQRLAQSVGLARSYDREAEKIDKQIGVLLDRIVEAGSPTVVAAYEKRIAQLERGKFALEERRAKAGQRSGTFEELFELAFQFLASPSKIWGLGKLEYQKLVLRLTFADRLAWCPNEGFRTPKTTLPFNMLGDANMGKGVMAERVGFEPTIEFPLYTRSRRAPSTTRPPLHRRWQKPIGCDRQGDLPNGCYCSSSRMML